VTTVGGGATPCGVPTGTTPGSLASLKQLVIDTQAPAPPVITSPADGSDTGPFAAALLAGTSEASATIAVTVDSIDVGTTTANGGGAWTFTTPALAPGPHSISATATDAVGNVSAPSTGITVSVLGGGTTIVKNSGCGLTGLEPGLFLILAALRRRARRRRF
jgi:hypothetical protein